MLGVTWMDRILVPYRWPHFFLRGGGYEFLKLRGGQIFKKGGVGVPGWGCRSGATFSKSLKLPTFKAKSAQSAEFFF